jgi:hypothetical protein
MTRWSILQEKRATCLCESTNYQNETHDQQCFTEVKPESSLRELDNAVCSHGLSTLKIEIKTAPAEAPGFQRGDVRTLFL